MSKQSCKIELDWFNPVLNPNKKTQLNPKTGRRKAIHWSVRARAKKIQRADTTWLALAAGKPSERDIYELNVMFYPPCKRGRDIDNCMAALKSAFDGIADAWGVNDKNFRYPNPDFGEVVEGGKITIEVMAV